MFWNYEGITIAYVKPRRSEGYLGTEMWLKAIRMKNWIIGAYWKIGVFGIKFWRLELWWLNRNLLKKVRNRLWEIELRDHRPLKVEFIIMIVMRAWEFELIIIIRSRKVCINDNNNNNKILKVWINNNNNNKILRIWIDDNNSNKWMLKVWINNNDNDEILEVWINDTNR